jgi:putative methionine-R-sulfoxide reductase with GAF domain
LEQHIGLLGTANQLAREITRILDLDHLLDVATRLISEQFGFYHAGIFLYQDGKFESLRLTAASSYEGKKLVKKNHSLNSGQGIAGNVALSKKTIIISNVTEYEDYMPSLKRTKGKIVFPLMVHEVVLGVLDIQSDNIIHLPQYQIDTLRSLADQLANAIYAVQHYEKVQKRSEALRALYKAGKEITSATSLEDILKEIAIYAHRLARRHHTRAQYGLVALYENNKMQITATYPSGKLHELYKMVGKEIDLTRGYGNEERIGIAGRALLEGIIINEGDVRQHKDYIEFNGRTRSQLVVPIQYQRQTFGVISVEHPQLNAFDEEDERTLKMLADQAAIAIHMYNIKGYVGKFTAVRWMKMVSDTWQHSIWREVAISLRYITLIKKHLTSGYPLSKIREQADRLDKVIHRIENIPMTAPLSIEGESLDLFELIKNNFKFLWNREDFQLVTLELNVPDGKCVVRANRAWLRQAFELLTENAVQAMNEANSETKKLSVTCYQKDDSLTITFADTGPGIPDRFNKYIFVDRIEESKGTGMGLLLVKTILETYDGTIRVVESTPLGTEIAITLPVDTAING